MKRFARKTALVALVWLTAASTLFAGLPHFECVCPDGQRKSVCLGIPHAATGCCCGGSCCRPRGQDKEGAIPVKGEGGGCCCCSHSGQGTRGDKQERVEKAPADSRRANGGAVAGTPDDLKLAHPRCVRTVTHADDAAVTFGNKIGADRSPAVEPLALPAAPAPLVSLAGTAPWTRCWLLSHAPPPTDLVITLLHLVI